MPARWTVVGIILLLGIAALASARGGIAAPAVVSPSSTAPSLVECPPPPVAWQQYPYDLTPDIAFPAAEGYQGSSTDSYYASGILTGRDSGKRYGFLTIFVKNKNIYDILSADFHVFSVFDLDAGRYGTMSLLDLPPDYRTNDEWLWDATGHLGVGYRWPGGVNRFHARHDTSGALVPFSYRLDLTGTDSDGSAMAVSLTAEASQPPQAVGGCETYGNIRVYGQPDTTSYYQPLHYRGWIRRGEETEPVEGRVGWLDRQWFPDYAGAFAGPLAGRYGHQWSQLSLSNGYELALWRQFDHYDGDEIIDFTGLTITDPDGRTLFTDDFVVEVTSYFRDPGTIEPLLAPLQEQAGIRSSIRYFFDAYRLRVPSLALDVTVTPLVPAPAHLLPVDYFNGPVTITGSMADTVVTGFGFHERTLPLSYPSELIVVLRDSLRYLSDADVGSGLTAQQLAALAWGAKPLIDADRPLLAAAYLNGTVKPALSQIAPPRRAQLEQLADDVATQLFAFPDPPQPSAAAIALPQNIKDD